MISRTETERLAAMAHELRPDWPVRSLCTWLQADHANRAYQDIAVALAYIATDPTTQTPKRMNEAGPWWQASVRAGSPNTPTAVPRPGDPRCTVYGHEHELASNCRGCAVDRYEPTDGPTFTPLTPEQAARTERGARLVREALATARAAAYTEPEDAA